MAELVRNSRSRATAWGLLGACALAMALRVYGLGYGLPDIHHPDEGPILNRALSFATGHLNPHNFLYPTLYLYVLFAWEALFFLVGRLVGMYESLAAFQREFFVDPSRVVLAGRTLTAIVGTLTVVAVYRLGTRLYDRATGFGAAVFLAVAPFAVRDAHYIKLDVPVTFLVVVTLAALARLVTNPDVARQRRAWLAAGTLAGLAISTQYYAVFVIVPFVATAIADIRRSGRWWTSASLLAWSGVGAVGGFVAGSPFFLFEPSQVLTDFRGQRHVVIDRAVAAGAFSSLGRYLEILVWDALGWPVFVLGIVGLVASVVSDWRRGILLAGFALPFLAFLANTFPAARYLNVLLPTVCVAASYAAVRLARLDGRRARAVAAILVVGAAVPGLNASVRSDRFFRQVDTRTLAREVIERALPAGSSILIQPHNVQLRPSREGLIEALRQHLGSEARASIKFQAELALDPYPSPAYRTIYLGDDGLDHDKIYVSASAFGRGDLQALRELRVAYVVLTQYNAGNPAFAPLEAALNREGHIIATFSPYRAEVGADRRATVEPFFHNSADRIDPALERPGPTINIWQLN